MTTRPGSFKPVLYPPWVGVPPPSTLTPSQECIRNIRFTFVILRSSIIGKTAVWSYSYRCILFGRYHRLGTSNDELPYSGKCQFLFLNCSCNLKLCIYIGWSRTDNSCRLSCGWTISRGNSRNIHHFAFLSIWN